MKIHAVSATAVYADETHTVAHQLAMCGENLGPYAELSPVHPIGNFTSMTSPRFATVTCTGCRTAVASKHVMTGRNVIPGYVHKDDFPSEADREYDRLDRY